MGGREQKRKERAMNDLLEAKADIKMAAAKKEQTAQPDFKKGMSKEMDRVMLEGKTKNLPGMDEDEDVDVDISGAQRRRRQQKSLQLIRNNQAK